MKNNVQKRNRIKTMIPLSKLNTTNVSRQINSKHTELLLSSSPSGDPSLESSYTDVSRHRQKSGQKFETEIYNRLLSKGIVTTKLRVNVSRGLKKVSDAYFEGKNNKYWMESTTCLTTQARVDELILKKSEVQKTNPDINKWVVFFRKDSRQRSQSAVTIKNYRKDFESAGITFCVGDKEINTYIDGIVRNEQIKIGRPIRMARAENIPLSKIFKDENNRPNIKESVVGLTANIIENGFFTQLNVVPISVNGELTGDYQLTEGDNRHSSLLETLKLEHSFESGEDPLIPCSVVHWLTSEDIEEVNKLTIDTNTLSYPWKLTDYIDRHEKLSAEGNVPNLEKHRSYLTLQLLRSPELRKTLYIKNSQTNEAEILPETYLLYVFGPVKHGRTIYGNLDTKLIEDGKYRENEDNPEIIKYFLKTIFHPFYAWYRNFDPTRDKMLPRRFMRGLFARYLSVNTLSEIKMIVEIFKTLGKDMPIRESGITREFWDLIDSKLEKKLQEKVGKISISKENLPVVP